MAAMKWILIVDDEEGVLSILKNSLRMLGDEYRVVTAPNGRAALVELEQRPFHLVIADYKMAGMTGLELLEKIREGWPETRFVLMTAYGNASVEAEALRLKAYRYLSKPLEIDTFRQLVREALEDITPNRLGILFFSENDYREINEILDHLRTEVGARCVIMTDREGRLVAAAGVVTDLHLTRIASLLGGSIATLIEAGRVLDGEEDVINLAYREGKRGNLFVVNIGRQFLLLLVMEQGPFNSRLGSVWYAARTAAATLQDRISQVKPAQAGGLLGENIEEAVIGGLQNILSDPGYGSLHEKSSRSPEADSP